MSETMDKNALRWFHDARWGMFYHFGLYTLLGENENAVRNGPKAEYAALMQRFAAERFDAEAWVDCAASMGARYIVPTARHGEGFCLWPSKLTRYTVANTPCRHDIIGELAAACARRGDIKFALYFNWETWLNEGVNDDIWNRMGMTYPEFMEGQLTELLTGYGPIALLWFDHGHPTLTRDRLLAIHRTIKRLQPDCLVNNRGQTGDGAPIGDFRTPEREFPDSDPGRGLVIECGDSMGVHSWGFCRSDAIWSTPTLAARASECASKGYNYLLNVEPAPDGTIREECVKVAAELGAWIKANGSALAALPSPVRIVDPNIQEEPFIGRCTRAGVRLYLHFHQWPSANEILLPVDGRIKKGALSDRIAERGLIVGRLPSSPPSGSSPWVVPLDFESEPRLLPEPQKRPIECDPSGSQFLAPGEASVATQNAIIIPKLNRFPDGRVSMGSLHHVDDTLTWCVAVPAGGAFDVYMALGSVARQEGAVFRLSSPVSQLEGRTWLTEHYSKPTRRAVGRLQLPSGTCILELRVTAVPNGSFSDVHGIWLVPVSRPPASDGQAESG